MENWLSENGAFSKIKQKKNQEEENKRDYFIREIDFFVEILSYNYCILHYFIIIFCYS